jgi:hypothetical protein
VCGRVVGTSIGFDLDDPAGSRRGTYGGLEHAPEQIARDTDGVAREELLRERAGYSSSGPRITFWIAALIRLRSPPSSSDSPVSPSGCDRGTLRTGSVSAGLDLGAGSDLGSGLALRVGAGLAA